MGFLKGNVLHFQRMCCSKTQGMCFRKLRECVGLSKNVFSKKTMNVFRQLRECVGIAKNVLLKKSMNVFAENERMCWEHKRMCWNESQTMSF